MSPTPAREPGAAVPRRVWGATALSALGRQWGSLCTVAALALLARTLPLAEFGRFTFYLALLAWLDVLIDAASSTVVVQRGAAGEPAFARALAAGRWLRRRTALLAAGLLTGGAWLLDPGSAPWVTLAALGALARVPELSSVVFQRQIAWGRPVAWRALAATLRLAALFALTRAGVAHFGPYLAAHAAALALGHLALALVARARLPRQAAVTLAERRAFLAAALPLALTGLVQQAYFHVDNAFLLAWSGSEELGRYNAAVRVFSWLVFFPAFASTSALPWLARREHAGDLGRAALRLALPMTAVGAVLVALLWPFAEALLTGLFGAPFAAAAPSLRLLLLGAVCVCAGAACLTAVIAGGRPRAALGIATAALAVNVVLNAWLVPQRGAAGAALATLVTEATVLVLAALYLVRARAPARTPGAVPGPGSGLRDGLVDA